MLDLDEALERFQACDVEYMGGLSNHGPMAAEALAALGHPALIAGFVDVYAPRIPAFLPGAPIPRAERAIARGRFERVGDWVATYECELAERAWRDVVREGVEEGAAGLFAAAGHGWLRVAHAVRALEAEESSVRRRELAFGLGYWAARHRGLPGNPGARPARGSGPLDVLARVQRVPEERRRPGLFTRAVEVLDEEPDFAAAIEAADLAGGDFDSGAFTSAICAHAAGLYLAHPTARIAYVHAVTVPRALRLLERVLEPGALRRAAGFALQAVAALHAVSAGSETSSPSDEVERLAQDPDEIRYRAACSLEEHAIKLSEACLAEDALSPNPRLRLAAADAALHIQ